MTGRLRRGYRGGQVTPPTLRTFVVGVSVYALDPNERILLLRRAKTADFEPGHWEPVSGRVEPGEDIRGTAVRELFEETRLEATKIIPFETFSFERRPGYVLHGVAMVARVPTDAVVLSSEHSEYRWTPSTGPLPGITLALGVGETLGYLRAHLPRLVALL